jgi:hypothetical protein
MIARLSISNNSFHIVLLKLMTESCRKYWKVFLATITLNNHLFTKSNVYEDVRHFTVKTTETSENLFAIFFSSLVFLYCLNLLHVYWSRHFVAQWLYINLSYFPVTFIRIFSSVKPKMISLSVLPFLWIFVLFFYLPFVVFICQSLSIYFYLNQTSSHDRFRPCLRVSSGSLFIFIIRWGWGWGRGCECGWIEKRTKPTPTPAPYKLNLRIYYQSKRWYRWIKCSYSKMFFLV